MTLRRYFMKLRAFRAFATNLAELSCCRRAKVAAVAFTADCRQPVGIGYNGPPVGSKNDSCRGEEGGCGCVHAEQNVVLASGLLWVQKPVLLYTTLSPCEMCARTMLNAGSGRLIGVIYEQHYRDRAGIETLRRAGWCTVVQWSLLEAWAAGVDDPDTRWARERLLAWYERGKG